VEAVAAKLLACVTITAGFLWDSLYGLIFGFLISAIAQVVFSRGALERVLGPGMRGIVNGTAFGIVASACSYGAAAAARGFYAKGADLRAVLAFMISSTNMNVAIVIMFWAMLGWRFAFAEFFGGIAIIAVVASGATLLLEPSDLRSSRAGGTRAHRVRIEACLQCGMDGDEEHTVDHDGTTYLFCGSRHEAAFRADPAAVLAAANAEHAETAETHGLAALRVRSTWRSVLHTMLADLEMLRSELVLGFAIAGCAAALVPVAWLSGTLQAVASVPVVGYPLLLLTGLLLAVVTFVCSMGNVPIARFLAMAGIPIGANTTFIYGDLLIPPLVGIYRKSFPPKVVWTFLGLFVFGALLAGAMMDLLVGHTFGASMEMGSTTFSDRFTLVANIVALIALALVIAVARGGRGGASAVAAETG
jgi:uncharacterized membrane protein YraQ (UPF0718 family)